MKICYMVMHVCNIAENFFAMQNAKPLKQEKEKKQDAEPMDSELSVLLEKIRLKNEALKKIYDFFGKEKPRQ